MQLVMCQEFCNLVLSFKDFFLFTSLVQILMNVERRLTIAVGVDPHQQDVSTLREVMCAHAMITLGIVYHLMITLLVKVCVPFSAMKFILEV